ncbi:UDP-N-acetylmuramoyl-L-alanine--D-glutamate ligase, partial [Candidatus Latescibacterota bacterium]
KHRIAGRSDLVYFYVTGSNGKTTTVAMIKSILGCSGLTHWVGGNIGGSLLSELEHISPRDTVVLELSSFQLEWLRDMAWSPHIAAVLNILPNHLDRHGTFQSYLEAKAAILDYQKIGNRVVLVRDDPGSRSLADRARGRVRWVGTDPDIKGITIREGKIVERSWRKTNDIIGIDRLAVPGSHNLMNAMAAAACSLEMGIEIDAILRGLESFRGLPHRLEPVGEAGGVKFYNDSKATTPEAATAGVMAFDTPVIPVFGGYDKGVSFYRMAHAISGRVKWAALIGTTAPNIAKSLERACVQSSIYTTLDEAFKACVSRARDGDTVLLSPGCASYDMFNDYEERGVRFRELVREYVESK